MVLYKKKSMIATALHVILSPHLCLFTTSLPGLHQVVLMNELWREMLRQSWLVVCDWYLQSNGLKCDPVSYRQSIVRSSATCSGLIFPCFGYFCYPVGHKRCTHMEGGGDFESLWALTLTSIQWAKELSTLMCSHWLWERHSLWAPCKRDWRVIWESDGGKVYHGAVKGLWQSEMNTGSAICHSSDHEQAI